MTMRIFLSIAERAVRMLPVQGGRQLGGGNARPAVHPLAARGLGNAPAGGGFGHVSPI
jgi:hypothetical protein